MNFIKINKSGYITFYDKKRQSTRTIGKSSGLIKNDYEIYSNFSKKFYLENRDLIPKNIYYNKKNELFYVSIYFQNKTIGLGSFHTLEEAEKQLLDFKISLLI